MAALVVGLLGVFVVLPRWVDGPPPENSTDVVVTSSPAPELPNPVATPEPPPGNDGLRRTLDAALGEGRSALEARDPQAAATAFRRAATLDPENAAAQRGLRQAESLATLLALENRALAAEKRGEIENASDAARRALELDPNSQVARGVSDRMAARLRLKSYQELVTRGLTALETEDYEKAFDAFTAAGERQPSAPEVADGLARAREGMKRRTIADHLNRATDAEDAENWRQAVTEYRAALSLDSDLGAARTGLKRSAERLQLAQRMVYHLEHPDRLATDEVLAEAQELVEEAKTVEPAGPRHQAFVRRLDGLVTDASTPVPVILQSDGRTEVVIYRVKQFGAFEHQRVDLRPGTYTAVGRRPGFRDVRVTFRISPGISPEPVIIRCTEEI